MVNIFIKILKQAKEDALNGKDAVQRDAVRWFSLDDKDFCNTCRMAGVNPADAVEAAKYNIPAVKEYYAKISMSRSTPRVASNGGA